jgi:YD repeat-containing protein
MSYIQNGVDPRTGQYTLGINLPALRSYDLNGPELPIALTYNPLNTLDGGYGKGWDLKLSQFTVQSRILALSTGETFKVTGSSAQSEPDIKEKKLASFRFFEEGGGHYRVVHKSGLVEHLEVQTGSPQVALPKRIESAQGQRLTLTYGVYNSTPFLTSIRDETSLLLQVVRDGNLVHIDQRPGAGEQGAPWARYTLQLESGSVKRIVLPTQPEASWRFEYQTIRDLLCLKTVHSPAGSREELGYEDGGHVFPGGGRSAGEALTARMAAASPQASETLERVLDHRYGPRSTAPQALPRVTSHVTHPGSGQPSIRVEYTYGLNGVGDSYNFLGHGAQGVVYDPSGLDNLYQATHPYQYGSTEKLIVDNQAVRTIERTFNGYHLLIAEKTTQNSCVKHVLTTYPVDASLPFDLQVPQCQLPAEVSTHWTDLAAGSTRTEREFSTYDTSGNIIRSVANTGVEELTVWYPAQGGDGCPEDPWGLVRYVQSKTVTPANSAYTDVPVLTTRYRYEEKSSLVGADKPWVALVSETLFEGPQSNEVELQSSVTTYVDKADSPTEHGRPSSVSVTFVQKDKAGQVKRSTSVTRYAYVNVAAQASRRAGVAVQATTEPSLQTTETLTTHDNLTKSVIRLESILTGNTLLDRDDNNVEIRTAYNALDQVIAETAAPGTPQEATRVYAYTLVNEAGGIAEQRVTDVKGVQTRTTFDGLNRAIFEARQQEATSARAGEFLQTYGASYDAYGQLTEEIEYDWRLGDAPALPGVKFDGQHFNWLADDGLALTTTFTYDDWGQQCSATGPDGVVEHEQADPTTLVTAAWREGMGKTLTTLNLFEKPVRVERQTAAGVSYSAETSSYDGLGRLRETSDAINAKTTYQYDVFDRLTLQVLPDRARVVRDYADHTSEDLPVSIAVNDMLLGTQAFDGLSRMTQSITGNRPRTYLYRASETQPAFVHTAAGATIEYDYVPHLSDEPVARRIAGEAIEASYELDPQNARMLSSTESAHTMTRDYFSTGELKSEQRSEGGQTYGMEYVYSLQGRLLSYTDVLGNTQTHTYDLAGRLVGTELGTTKAVLTYNAVGLNDSINTEDSAIAQQVNVSLTYDEFGREVTREFDLGAGQRQILEQTYTRVDQMRTRTLSQASEILRDEKFVYDPRGRLTEYEAQGPEAPYDPAGKQISAQYFYCDALDNHVDVTTVFGDGATAMNIADYFYSNEDPAQLISIRNSHEDYSAFNMELNYDRNGNLQQDEAGRRLTYDAYSRLVQVTPADGTEGVDYHYDAVDILSSAANERRFYRAGELACLVEEGQGRTIMRAGGALLAELQADTPIPSAVKSGRAKKAKS